MWDNKNMIVRTNPVVEEAICYVGFQPILEESIFADYYQIVRDEYPTFAPLPQQVVMPEYMRTGGLRSSEQTPQQFLRFNGKNETAYIILSLSSLSFHVVKPYPGWDELLRQFAKAWQILLELVPLTGVTQLAVHYINIIPSSEGDILGDWLKENEFISLALLDSDPLPLCRVQKNSNGGMDFQRVSVHKGFPKEKLGNDEVEAIFVWEIVRGSIEERKAETSALLSDINIMHDDVRKNFDTAVGPRLDDFMRNETVS